MAGPGGSRPGTRAWRLVAALVLAAAVVLVLVLTRGRGLAATALVGSALVVVVGGRPAWQRLLQLGSPWDDAPVAQGSPPPVLEEYCGRAPSGPPHHDALARPAPDPAGADGTADDLQVRWWRRDGHDRLYVTSASGASLGWLDRSTGRLHVLDERNRAAVGQALGAARGVEDKRTA